jgi:hypothetical protein
VTDGEAGIDDLLMPHMRRVGVDCQAHLFAQFATERDKQRLTVLDTPAGSRPDDHVTAWFMKSETAEEDSIFLVENDRSNRTTQLHR